MPRGKRSEIPVAQMAPPPQAQAHANGTSESSNQKFVRLGEKRMSSLKSRARMVKNLATYDHTPEQKEKLLAAVEHIAAEIKQAFDRSPRAVRDDSFRFL